VRTSTKQDFFYSWTSVCDSKNRHYYCSKVVWHSQQMFKMSIVCNDTSTEALGPMPFLHLAPGWGTSSPRTRDGRSRAADMRDAGFHTSVTVATQQSWSKSCGLYCMGRAPGARLHEKIRTVEELQQHITEEYECIDQRVIDNAVKQWRKRFCTCVAVPPSLK